MMVARRGEFNKSNVGQYRTCLWKRIKLRTDRVYATSDTDRVMKDCIASVDFV
jgi:hypothetical protein